ncbi:MAG: tyrosine-type recombinase/integrase [Clostridia bacterium]|nr:tyrosine-type recombinase/integrase [Clostridia bacterium]
MKKLSITPKAMKDFACFLRQEERSVATIGKYLRDIGRFAVFSKGKEIEKELLLAYKQHLSEHYAVTSANSMIAALNAFLRFLGHHELCIKQFRVQRDAFCPRERELSREEYLRLLATAKRQRNERLYLVLQTICGTGIRVSELSYITVEAVRRGEATVNCKGKRRRIFLVRDLQRHLLRYAESRGIGEGAVFRTRNGTPLSRYNIWKEMKGLCREARVAPEKVFPHNLRHLFARCFYGMEKDIAKLADILGHASINTTRIYITTTCEEHRRKMERLRLIV